MANINLNIIIVGLNYAPEPIGTGKFTAQTAEWLAKSGHTVQVVCAPPYYPQWKTYSGYKSYWYRRFHRRGVNVLNCPAYIPCNVSLSKRLLHLLSFSFSSFFPVLWMATRRPTHVILIAPTIICAPQVLLLRLISRCRLLVHIQDYELDAMSGLNLTKSGYFFKFLLFLERSFLCSADCVTTISDAMMAKARVRGVAKERLGFFPNWADVPGEIGEVHPPLFVNEVSSGGLKKLVLYSGNIGEKQGLEALVDVARHFPADEVSFLVVGDGAARARLERQVVLSELPNIYFRPPVSEEFFFQLLASADCHLVLQRGSISDSVMPSKVSNIFAVGGNCVITAERETALGAICEANDGLAVLVSPDSVEALVEGIKSCLAKPKVNQIAIEYSNRFLRRPTILASFVRLLESL